MHYRVYFSLKTEVEVPIEVPVEVIPYRMYIYSCDVKHMVKKD